jgi:hypothetical protein
MPFGTSFAVPRVFDLNLHQRGGQASNRRASCIGLTVFSLTGIFPLSLEVYFRVDSVTPK